MKWSFTHFKSMGPHEALNHIGEKNIDCPSMVVFLNMLLLKNYHAHNIHHCPLYPISNIGLGFCYSILKGKLFLFLTFFGENIGRALIVWWHTTVLYCVFKNSFFFFFYTTKTLIVLECCTVFSIFDMFTIGLKLLRNISYIIQMYCT